MSMANDTSTNNLINYGALIDPSKKERRRARWDIKSCAPSLILSSSVTSPANSIHHKVLGSGMVRHGKEAAWLKR